MPAKKKKKAAAAVEYKFSMTHFEAYNKIIDFRRRNPLPKDQYGERHHVVPRSVCPLLEKIQSNIVKLSAAEHFIAHWHLWQAYKYELKEKKWARSMCFAFNLMKKQLAKCQNIPLMSRLYEEARKDISLYQKGKANPIWKVKKDPEKYAKWKANNTQANRRPRKYKSKHMVVFKGQLMTLKAASALLGWSWGSVLNIVKKFESDEACLEYLINPQVNRPPTKKVAQYSVLDDKLVQIWPSAKEAAQTLGKSLSAIHNCLIGKSKTSGGFKWKYV